MSFSWVGSKGRQTGKGSKLGERRGKDEAVCVCGGGGGGAVGRGEGRVERMGNDMAPSGRKFQVTKH